MLTHVSTLNRIFVALFLAGGVWAAIHGRWLLVAFIVVALAYAMWAIRASLRGRTTDTGRLDIGQPTDERDRLLLDRALAAVGLAALAFECGLFLYGVGGPDPAAGAPSGLPFAGLCLVRIIPHPVVVRRDATRSSSPSGASGATGGEARCGL